VLRLPDHSWEAQAASLNETGLKHWELVAILEGLAYLKRPIEHKNELPKARVVSEEEWSRLRAEERRRDTERRPPPY
jgi:hypothetical protein